MSGRKAGQNTFILIAIAFIFAAVFIQVGSPAVVVGIDYGTEWYKVMMIKGKEFVFVLNDQAKRKNPTIVGFTSDNERVFNDDAKSLSVRDPKRVFKYAHHLLGKQFGDPIVEKMRHHYPFELVKDESRGVYALVRNETTTYTPEQVAGMIFEQAKSMAETFGNTVVKDCVVTVPPYLTQRERLAIITAAKLGGLNVLSLMNEGLGAAIAYSLIREEVEQGSEQYVVVYDMGAGTTSATLVKFKNVQDTKKNKTVLNVLTAGSAWDQNLGGRDFDLRLAEHLHAVAKKQLKKPLDTPRIRARLLAEARKAKEVLSANQEMQLMIESLTNEDDFRYTVTRAEFEKLCEDLFPRSVKPIYDVLEKTGVTPEDVHAIELIGGGNRIPKIQDLLAQSFGKEKIGKHLNGDEAAVYGSTFYAATQSSSFRIKNPIRIKDTLAYKMAVDFSSLQEKEEDDLYKVIFDTGARLGTKKSISIRQAEDFSFKVLYEKTDNLPEGTPLLIANYNISDIPTNKTVNFTGVPKIIMSFKLTASGIFEVVKADAEVITYVPKPIIKPKPKPKQETPTNSTSTEDSKEDEKASKESEDANVGTEKEKDAEAETEPEKQADETENETEASEQEAENEETETTSEKQDEETETASEKQDEATGDEEQQTEGNSENAEATSEEEEEVAEPTKPEIEYVRKTKRFPLTVTLASDLNTYTRVEFLKAKKVLTQLTRLDKAKKQREKDKNELESFVYETKAKLYDDDVMGVTQEEERETLRETLMDVADWLYDEGYDADAATFRAKLTELKGTVAPIFIRLTELTNRPKAVDMFRTFLNASGEVFINKTRGRNVTREEKREVLSSIKANSDWLEEKVTEQEKLQPYEDPVLTSKDINFRAEELMKSMQNLQRRPRLRPKKVASTNKTVNGTTTNSTTPDAGDNNTSEEENNAEGTNDEANNEETETTDTAEETTNNEAEDNTETKAETAEEKANAKREKRNNKKKGEEPEVVFELPSSTHDEL